MKTRRVTMCCVALLLALTSVSAVPRKLDSINDLKRINFGQSVPTHSLLLLYWFANAVDIDNNFMRLTFDPESRAFGSHHYGNFEGLLDNLPWGNVRYQYYTIGSLNQDMSMQLPPYVVRPPATEYVGSNRDRIIIRVREPITGWEAQQRIDQVYITQHIENQQEYDPAHTYMISTNLLRQIREFSVGENQQQLLQLRNRFGSNADLSHIRNTWVGLAGLGLLLFIVIQERFSFTQQNNRPENTYRPENDFPPLNNWGPQNNYRPQNWGPQNNYRPQNNYGHANNGEGDALGMCLLFAFVFICVFVVFMVLGF